MIKRFAFIVVLVCFAFRSLYSFGMTFINEPFQLNAFNADTKTIVHSSDHNFDNSQLPFDLKEKEETEIEENEETEHLPLYFIKVFSVSYINKLLGFNTLKCFKTFLTIKTYFSPIYIQIHSLTI